MTKLSKCDVCKMDTPDIVMHEGYCPLCKEWIEAQLQRALRIKAMRERGIPAATRQDIMGR
jgi:hypothetical protein